ncbi:hypothetical protein CC79DRAFT_1281919 [Sarocladium strictum]
MKITSIVVGAVAFAVGSDAWAKSAAGVWTANNTYHTIRGSSVHEACTTMNTQNIHAKGAFCAYWVNGIGEIKRGKCRYEQNSVHCK